MSAPGPTLGDPTASPELGFARAVLACLLPGLLAGTQVAGILFFLNPHLPFEPVTVIQGILFYGTLLGLASFLLLLPLTRGDARRVRRWLPPCLTLVLVLAALGFWTHAYYFGYFLPPGINKRLLKAAIWLSLAALISFYTVIWHRFRRRPYGRRGRMVFVLMAVAAVYVVVERREAFRPKVEPVPRATTFEGSGRPQLCVVGIEAATLDAILPLAEQGRLPFFSQILQQGAHSRLSSLEPTRRTPLWTTLATGKYPYKHGVVSERLYDAIFLRHGSQPLNLLPVAVGFEAWGTWGSTRRVDRTDLRVLPLWRILSRLGMTTALVGWPGSSPAKDGADITLTDLFFEDGGNTQGVVPASLAQRARLFRTPPDGMDPVVAARFGADPPAEVLQSLARDQWREDLAFFLLDREPPIDALFLLLPGLGEISSRYFGGYSAVQFEAVQDPESVEASRLLRAYYAHLDDFLANLWQSMRPPRLLTVVSSHGVRGPNDLQDLRRSLLRRPAVQGYVDDAPDGVLMALGSGVRPGAAVRSAALVDVLPTLLYGLGYPIARDGDGGVLTDLFETTFLARQPLIFVPSYETFTPSPG